MKAVYEFPLQAMNSLWQNHGLNRNDLARAATCFASFDVVFLNSSFIMDLQAPAEKVPLNP